MKVKRRTDVFCTSEELQVGDVLSFTLTTGEEVEAMAMKRESDGMIFALVDCLEEKKPMKIDGVTVMQEYLKDIVETFPEDIKAMMVPMYEEEYLRLMTEKEVFGYNEWADEEESEDVEQFEPMKDRRNRIAYRGKGVSDTWQWYWLSNHVSNASAFASVSGYGYAAASNASTSYGVRPAFKIF